MSALLWWRRGARASIGALALLVAPAAAAQDAGLSDAGVSEAGVSEAGLSDAGTPEVTAAEEGAAAEDALPDPEPAEPQTDTPDTEVPAEGEVDASGETPTPGAPRRRRRRRRVTSWDPVFGGSLVTTQSVGGISGFLTRPVRGIFVQSEIDFAPQLVVGELTFRTPLSVRARDIYLDPLTELRGIGGGEIRWRASSRFRMMASGGVRGVYRPGWPDRYQPRADGTLTPTDRYSYWRADAQLEISGIPITHHHARLEYRYQLVEYQRDPGFDPLNRPTHLVPRNAVQHTGRVSWHYLEGDVRFGGEVEAFHRQYLFAFARDRGTGLTHAGPGGAPPNPLEALVGIHPAIEGRVDLDEDRFRIDLRYRHEVILDVFQGYRSQHGPNVRLRLSWQPFSFLTFSTRSAFLYRIYFDGGYQMSSNHPLPLDDGAQRYDWRIAQGAEVEIRLRPHLYLMLTYDFAWRQTNFPDYQPGVFPAIRQYTLDWDYENHRGLLSVRYDLTF